MTTETPGPCPICGAPTRHYQDGTVSERECTVCEFTISAAHFALFAEHAALARAVDHLNVYLHAPRTVNISAWPHGAGCRVSTHIAEGGYNLVGRRIQAPSLAAALIALAAEVQG